MIIGTREANISNGIDNRTENAEGFEKRIDSIKLGCRSTCQADRLGSGFRILRDRPDCRYALLCVLDVNLNWFVTA